MKKSLTVSIILIFSCVFGIEARPQMMMDPDDVMDDIFIADGFSFDGPADRSNPNFMNRPPVVTNQPVINGNNPTTSRTSTISTTVSPVLTNCIQSCLATSEFNPVCGTDGVDYSNPGRLTCAQQCGKDVRLLYFGRCSSSNPRG